MELLVITNNALLSEINNILFIEGSSKEVLKATRDQIYLGHHLLRSPLGASIRMLLSPVCTTIVSFEKKELDLHSVQMIEGAIEKHSLITDQRGEDLKNQKDYQVIDKELFYSACIELGQGI